MPERGRRRNYRTLGSVGEERLREERGGLELWDFCEDREDTEHRDPRGSRQLGLWVWLGRGPGWR